MSDFNSLVQYTVENISRPVKYIIYKLTEFIRVVDKFVFRQVPSGAASGYATIEKIEGNTVAWNNNTRNNITGTLVTKTDDIYTVSGSTVAYNGVAQVGTSKPREGHKYYLSAFVTQNSCGTRMFLNPNPSNMGANALIVPIGGTGLYHTIVTISSAASQVYTWQTYSAFNGIFSFYAPSIIDLTAIFGAGNEPSTVADFEAWMAQNIGTLPYYDYNAGELLSCKMSGIQTEDSSQQTLDTIALDVTTITGINTSTNVREVIFADGMNKASDNDVDIIDLTTDTAERATFVLPDTYQELEWLKTDGNAYIQTSLLVNRLYTYKLKFNVTDFNYGGWVLGAKVSAAGYSNDFGVSLVSIRFGTQYVNKDFTTYNDVELIINDVGYTINGENTEWGDTPTLTDAVALKLFWAQNSAAQKLGKIYYLQILDSNGVSLLHLIPAKRIADSVLGMYDMVSNTFLSNAGTGDFVAGPVVVKNVYPLSAPITYTDLQDANGNPLNPRYKVEQGGTEQVLPVNTNTPTTVAPTLTTTYTKDVH